MSEIVNEIFGGQGSGGGTGALIWNPQAQIGEYGYQVVEAGKKSGTGQYIITLSSTLQTIDQVNANTSNSHIAFIDDGVTGWAVTSTSSNQDKYTNPTSVQDEAELNATFTPPENYLEKYCFVLATETYWTVNNNGVAFVWYNTGQTAIDSYSKIEIDELLNLKKDKITPLTNAGTFGSASQTVTQQVNAQGDVVSISQQNIAIPSTQVTDFTDASQNAVGGALLGTATINLAYDDATNKISSDVKDLSLTNSKIALNANIETSKLKQTTITPVDAIFENEDNQDVINNKSQGQHNVIKTLATHTNRQVLDETQEAFTTVKQTNYETAYTHSQATGNPHNTTIADITGLETSLGEKELSSNKITTFSETPTDTQYPSAKLVKDNFDLKVNIETGKSLVSEEDILKLGGIEAGAEVNVNADWNATSGDAQILNKPTLATASAKDVGIATGQIQENGSELGLSQIVHTDASGKFTTVAKATGYNLPLGNVAETLVEGGTVYLKGEVDTFITDAKDLGNATGTMPIANVEGLQGQLDSKVALSYLFGENNFIKSNFLNPTDLISTKSVANQVERFALIAGTASGQVQNDDIIFQVDTATYYIIIDQTKLYIEDGYRVIGGGGEIEWDSITNKPIFGTASAKDVGSAIGQIQENGSELDLSQTVETDANRKLISVAKATGYNLPLGTTPGTVADGGATQAALDLKQNITDNTLNTTSKTIVGGINELKTSIDSKVVNSINDGATNTAPSEDAVFDALTLKTTSTALRQASTILVESLYGSDDNDGFTLDKPLQTLQAAWDLVSPAGQVKVGGASEYIGTFTFSSSKTSIKTILDDGTKIIGTINLVAGNTSMQFFRGKISAIINDASSGTCYFTNVNIGDATLNFSNGGYKVIANSTSAPTAINLTGTGGTLILQDITGGVVPLNIGAGWVVVYYNCIPAILSNDGTIVDGLNLPINMLIENQIALNSILVQTSSDFFGYYVVNFDNPVIPGMTIAKGDVFYKASAIVNVKVYTFGNAPASFSLIVSATERTTIIKDLDKWVVPSSLNLALGETSLTAYRGDRGKTAYDHSQITTGNPHGTTKADVGLGDVDNTADANKNVLSATKLTTARNINGVSFDGTADITVVDTTKEPAFTKNTAFNKNFGSALDTVTQGNDARLGTKDIDEANLANNKIQVYNAISGKLEYQDLPIGSTNLTIANKTATTLDITSDTGTDATIPEATITEAGLLNNTDKVKLNNTSNTNTGDETTLSIQDKRPLKTIEGISLEGIGDIDLNSTNVGLGNVDNTSDINKPISTIQQEALDTKLTITNNLNDVENRQSALNTLTNVSAASNDFVLMKDEGTGNAVFKELTGTTVVIDNLTSTNSIAALSANQGRVLNIGKEDAFTKNTAFNKNFGTLSDTVAVGNDQRFVVKRLKILIGNKLDGNKKGIAFSYGATIDNPFFSVAVTSGENNNDAFCIKIIQITTTSAYLEVYRADGPSWGDTQVSCDLTISSGEL